MTAKRNGEGEFKNAGDKLIMFNFSGHQKVDVAISDCEWTRREFLRKAAVAGLMLGVPWVDSAVAAVPPPPVIRFDKNKTGDGVVGPYGEVRIGSVGGQALPVIVSAPDGSAVMDCSGRSPFVRFGTASDSTAIILTSDGVQLGTNAKPAPWNSDSVHRLIEALAKDRKKARGAMFLRSALHTSYPGSQPRSSNQRRAIEWRPPWPKVVPAMVPAP